MANNLNLGGQAGYPTIPQARRAQFGLNSLAAFFDTNILARHALYLVATATIVLLYGYSFGTFDQALHIPSLKSFADPSLYPGDAYLALRVQHYSYFWMLLEPFYHLGILEMTLFIGHLIATYLTLWMLWTLSEQLFHNPLTNFISLVAFVLPHLGFGGWPLFEWSLLNRTFVFPFLIGAIILFLRGRVRWTFLLLGLTYNLHALTGTFALALVVFACLMEWRRIGWLKIVSGFGLFVLAALPVLLWKLSGPGGDLVVNREWFDVISLGMTYNEFAFLSTHPHILAATLSGLGTVGLYLIGRRYAPSQDHNHTVTLFVIAALLMLGVQVIVGTWLPVTLLVEFQIMRAGIWIAVFGILYFSNYLAATHESRTLPRADWLILTASFMFSVLAFVPVLVWGILKWGAGSVRARVGAVTVALGIAVLSGALILSMNLWQPSINIYPPQTDWNRVQFWARDNTPKETVFITPPEIWWLFTADWRVFSERSTVVTLSEILELAFTPNYLESWKSRFNELAPGALPQLNGNPADNMRIVSKAFYSLTDQDLLRLACKYQAAYLVIEKPHLRNFAVVYENDGFVAYAMPLETCATP